eukprot:COSAG04_NODE_23941_length_329_cov_146.991304_1_plen_89_part_10
MSRSKPMSSGEAVICAITSPTHTKMPLTRAPTSTMRVSASVGRVISVRQARTATPRTICRVVTAGHIYVRAGDAGDTILLGIAASLIDI